MIEQIQSRRDELADQMAQAQAQYTEIEAVLKELDRQMCAMAGGLQELDTLLSADKEESECLSNP